MLWGNILLAFYYSKSYYVFEKFSLEALNNYVTAAMFDGRNSNMFLHEDRYKSQDETCSIALFCHLNMAAVTCMVMQSLYC